MEIPQPRGHLGLKSAEDRPSRPRFTGGFFGISFRSRLAKHQENPGPKRHTARISAMGQHHCPNEGTLPDFISSFKGDKKNFRQKFQVGLSARNQRHVSGPLGESLS
jgi:hypothetical protein